MGQISYKVKPWRKRKWQEISDFLDERVGLVILFVSLLSLIGASLIIICTSLKDSLELGIGVLITGFTLSFNYRAHRIEKDKIFNELFEEFNQKYQDEYCEALSKIKDSVGEGKEMSLSTQDFDKIIGYLNLCAEEYLWFIRGRIPHKVWNSWEAGMISYLQLDPIKEALKKEYESSQFLSYYSWFDYLGKWYPQLLPSKS